MATFRRNLATRVGRRFSGHRIRRAGNRPSERLAPIVVVPQHGPRLAVLLGGQPVDDLGQFVRIAGFGAPTRFLPANRTIWVIIHIYAHLSRGPARIFRDCGRAERSDRRKCLRRNVLPRLKRRRPCVGGAMNRPLKTRLANVLSYFGRSRTRGVENSADRAEQQAATAKRTFFGLPFRCIPFRRVGPM